MKYKKAKNVTLMYGNNDNDSDIVDIIIDAIYAPYLGNFLHFKEDEDKELDLYDIPYLVIGDTITIKTTSNITSKDILNKLKEYCNLDAIVLENPTTILEDSFYFEDISDAYDYIIEQGKPFKFDTITASGIRDSLWEENYEKAKKLWEVSKDDNILADAARDIFLF